mmetsp:Transcript_725/g.1537  ORF Transcript_725/g.1537 Transcript_725/m.1537 type:complete len:386 (-) Transcript_725:357-1514(-)
MLFLSSDGDFFKAPPKDFDFFNTDGDFDLFLTCVEEFEYSIIAASSGEIGDFLGLSPHVSFLLPPTDGFLAGGNGDSCFGDLGSIPPHDSFRFTPAGSFFFISTEVDWPMVFRSFPTCGSFFFPLTFEGAFSSHESFKLQWLFSGDRKRIDGMSLSLPLLNGSFKQLNDFTSLFNDGDGFSAFLLVYKFSSSGEYDGLWFVIDGSTPHVSFDVTFEIPFLLFFFDPFLDFVSNFLTLRLPTLLRRVAFASDGSFLEPPKEFDFFRPGLSFAFSESESICMAGSINKLSSSGAMKVFSPPGLSPHEKSLLLLVLMLFFRLVLTEDRLSFSLPLLPCDFDLFSFLLFFGELSFSSLVAAVKSSSSSKVVCSVRSVGSVTVLRCELLS